MDIYEAFGEAEKRREERAKARAFDRIVSALETADDAIGNPYRYVGGITRTDVLAGFKGSVERIIKQAQKEGK